jgi:hypothetical protein
MSEMSWRDSTDTEDGPEAARHLHDDFVTVPSDGATLVSLGGTLAQAWP